ncbi:hypothetical protein A4H97_28905 [Niastella yeongjuensis]|uniref:Uncharacterized protein n=1 Tax=Niastella yeongjuensis TaxID=354355 RepID=A0A1V9ET87_9BACT|nr:hypothetical protein A4H97_28905 [Niastella yeongjuensis]
MIDNFHVNKNSFSKAHQYSGPLTGATLLESILLKRNIQICELLKISILVKMLIFCHKFGLQT